MSAPQRLLIVTGCLLAVAAYLAQVSRAESVPIREPLATCPVVISDWKAQHAVPFDEKTLAVLGVDEYINRVYRNSRGNGVGLYVGYYGSQRQGDTMHSPLNCLPGAGWTPVSKDRLAIHLRADTRADDPPQERVIDVNRYVIEKGLDRQLVLYWYQSHGRVIASEYWGKIYLVLDAIRTNRTDGALVRITSPIVSTPIEAERDAVDFVRVLFPLLERYLPS